MPGSVVRTPLTTLFELSGVVPLGVFLCVHLGLYASTLFGAAGASPGSASGALLVLEIALVWLPFALHAGYGLRSTFGALPAQAPERSASLLLRLTGAVALAFLAAHLYWFRWPIVSGRYAPGDAVLLLAERLSTRSGGVPLGAAAHLAGLLAVAAHFGLGLTRFLERWGVARGARVREICAGLGFVLFAFGAATVIDLATGSAWPDLSE
jgi:succinate dehydrogenase/fumarate reductase cytochrome b subunit